jgi:hypothetical protein
MKVDDAAIWGGADMLFFASLRCKPCRSNMVFTQKSFLFIYLFFINIFRPQQTLENEKKTSSKKKNLHPNKLSLYIFEATNSKKALQNFPNFRDLIVKNGFIY